MKHLSVIFLVLVALQVRGQDDNFYQLEGQNNLYPGNFPKAAGVKMVMVKFDCQICSPSLKQEHSATYFFNSQGFNIEQHTINKGRKWGVQKFFWNADGTVSKYQSFGSYTSNTLGLDSATYENDYGLTWDSTILSKEVIYTYGNKKTLKTITWIDGHDSSTEFVITFFYDGKGNLIREEIVDYPDKGDIILSFKPNSATALVERPDAKKQSTNFKLFKYLGDTIFVEYYKKGKLSGKGKKVVSKSGKLIYEATYSLSEDLLFEIRNIFNESGKPIDQTIFQTGYNGYGDGGDYAGGDRRTFEYDSLGRLTRIVEYYKEKVTSASTFEYK